MVSQKTKKAWYRTEYQPMFYVGVGMIAASAFLPIPLLTAVALVGLFVIVCSVIYERFKGAIEAFK